MKKFQTLCCALFALSFFAISIIAPAQQPAPGSIRQGFTVACPVGQHMDQDCADVANSEYFEDMLALNAQLASMMEEEEESYSEACWDCDSEYNSCVNWGGSIAECAEEQAECISFEQANHASTVSIIMAGYSSAKAELTAHLIAALKDCCREDQ